MPANKLLRCLIGSILLHTTIFVMVVVTMRHSARVTTHAIESFVVDTQVAGIAEPQPSKPPRSQRVTVTNPPETGQFRQALPSVNSSPPPAPLADQAPKAKASPPVPPSDLTASQPAPGKASATVAENIAPLPARPQEENLGSKQLSPRQGPPPVRVMALGEAGSPRFIHKEAPIYPFVARKLGKEGKVVLKVALNDQGQLQRLETVETNGFGFDEAASAAIRKSTFAPAVINGKAVPSQVLVPVKFVLNASR